MGIIILTRKHQHYKLVLFKLNEMKKILSIVCLILIVSCSKAQQIKHVVLITIDGFRPDFYLEDKWHTPNLKMLMQQGFYAKGVNSVLPSMTYPSHTTIVTGVQPAKHGIYYNGMFEPDTIKGKIYWNYASIHVPTLWQAVHNKGGKVAALFWPVSADAPADYLIPDNGSMGEANRIAYSKPAGFIETLQKDVFNDTGKINYGVDHNVAQIAAYVIKQAAPELMTVHFFSVDHFEHMQGREGELVEKAISDADSAVGIVWKAIQDKGIADNTLFIVTGDHGFETVTTSVNPNVWLKEAGLITDLKNGGWKARFLSVGGSTYLYLKNRNDKATLDKVNSILNNLPDSVKQYLRIISRQQLNSIGGNPEVEFAISGLNGASFGNAENGDAIKAVKTSGAHGYFPDTKNIRAGFIAFGKTVNKGSVDEMNERDITSVVIKALGLNFPTAEGKLPEGLFK